jgi:hypothetical protein
MRVAAAGRRDATTAPAASQAKTLGGTHVSENNVSSPSEFAALEAEVLPWLELCGSCDAGLLMGCTCPKGDFRNTMLKLWRAYEAKAGATGQDVDTYRGPASIPFGAATDE